MPQANHRRAIPNPPGGNDNPQAVSIVLRDYAELLRLPNIFTAMADVVMGFFFVSAVAGWTDVVRLGVLVAASSFLYAAGVVLNDRFDLEEDRVERPERPLPSGRIALRTATRLGWSLLAFGVAMGLLGATFNGRLRPALVAVALAGCIVFYNAALKRTPLGCVGMGACRMLNVLLGMSATDVRWGVSHFVVAGGVGVYIAGVTWLARNEAGRSARSGLLGAIAVMMLGVGLLAWLPAWIELRLTGTQWWGFMAVLGALIAWQCRSAVMDPSPPRVQMAVKQCILSLVLLDAAVALAVGGPVPGVAVLLLLIPTVVLGQWIRST